MCFAHVALLPEGEKWRGMQNRVRDLWDIGTCNLVCINMDITVYNCLQYLISSDSRLVHSSAALSLQGA